MSVPKKSIYLPNLNGVRAIAAFMVVIHHLEFFISMNGQSSFAHIQTIKSMGKIAVIMFFSLSGFLITYLIEKEKQATGSCSISDFYVRRVLRIWPVYFVVVLIGLFVIPFVDWLQMPNISYQNLFNHPTEAYWMFLTFLPNFFLNYFGAIPNLSHTWSIGVEEQFYLIWPLLLRWTNKAWRPIFWFIILYSTLRILGKYWVDAYTGSTLYFPPLNALAIGGFCGILYVEVHENGKYKWLINRALQLVLVVLAFIFISLGLYFPLVYFEVYSALFGLIFVSLASSSAIISFENRIMNHLGKISYGLYMYHPLVINFVIAAMLATGYFSRWLLYALTIGLTILIAHLSYNYMERWFITKKLRFSKISSGFDSKAQESEK